MRSNELRIGNLLEVTGKIDSVSSISFGEVKFFNTPEGVFKLKWTKPIPLTEEWLVKLGVFETNNNIKSLHKVSWCTVINSYEFLVGWTMADYGGIENEIAIEIKHVHQLQNLYFALTGKELEMSK